MERDNGLFALLRNDDDLALTGSEIKHRIRWIALRKDDFILPVSGYGSARTYGRKKCLNVEWSRFHRAVPIGVLPHKFGWPTDPSFANSRESLRSMTIEGSKCRSGTENVGGELTRHRDRLPYGPRRWGEPEYRGDKQGRSWLGKNLFNSAHLEKLSGGFGMLLTIAANALIRWSANDRS